MKKSLFIAITLAACFSSCIKDELRNEPENTIDVTAPVFHAGFVDKAPETKTYINLNGHLRWNADDRLTIFVGKTLNTEYAFDGEDGDNAGGFNQVSGGGFVTANPLDANYAVYPYSKSTKISEEGVISLSLPDVQAYGEDTFGRGANTMVAITENKDDYYLPFKNVCGYLVLKLYGDALVKSIQLEGRGREKIAGEAYVTPVYGEKPEINMGSSATNRISIDCGNGVLVGKSRETATSFWLCIPPTTFNEGISICVEDSQGKVFTKATGSVVDVERNVIKSMTPLDIVGLSGPTHVIFDDAEFEAFCLNHFDLDKDGTISMEEADLVTTIEYITNAQELSLGCLKYFSKLKSIQITNMGYSRTTLSNFDVSHNSLLQSIECINCNAGNNINLSMNTALITFIWEGGYIDNYIVLSKNQSITNFRYNNYYSIEEMLMHQGYYGIVFESGEEGGLESVSWGNEID